MRGRTSRTVARGATAGTGRAGRPERRRLPGAPEGLPALGLPAQVRQGAAAGQAPPTRQQAEAEEPNIPAFTLRQKATIYMRSGADAHVMLHEAFHLLSHSALGAAAGSAADEGATEFFRMQATPVADRAGHPVHPGYLNAHNAIEATGRS